GTDGPKSFRYGDGRAEMARTSCWRIHGARGGSHFFPYSLAIQAPGPGRQATIAGRRRNSSYWSARSAWSYFGFRWESLVVGRKRRRLAGARIGQDYQPAFLAPNRQ